MSARKMTAKVTANLRRAFAHGIVKPPRLTPWYPPEIKPMRVGWYPRRQEGGGTLVWMNFWDAHDWHYNADGYAGAAAYRIGRVAHLSGIQYEWRGLAK